ncbi:C45 family autoproteolytic acyltransferase/hydolase [Anaerococcus sp.]|uniref:C45 family autoproteolytic acyltransferase/hydolase n=1 Tax=Anaerococcus sp. TaxID=1872515 RepID=UPI00280BC5DA|nr:C45 family autoproteolytic acyltransferase/hydolase [Anaerococcus sp.]MDU3177520.1 C45 family autoproteolytic acyltransferase/hydrolase [Anaerococcus sp.]MDU7411723.1 C45 family autoproteolytic acyltransferase/hydrolase [Anaerococcus sp.]
MYHSRWKGSHYEAGFKYGNLLFKNNKKPNFDKLINSEKLEYSKKAYQIYNKFYSEILDEIQGFADGLKIDFDIVFAFLASMYVFTGDVFCSCICISNSRGIFLARNSDFDKSIKNLTDSAFYKIDNEYSFVGNTTAMIQMEDGINRKGLACGLTFVYPTVRGVGFNAGFLIRYILEKCSTVDQARVFLENVDIGSSQNIIVIDKSGKILLAELNSNDRYFEQINGGCIYRTNHFISNKMAKYKAEIEDDIYSHDRYETLEYANSSLFDIDDIKSLLSGRFGFMCQYDRNSQFDTLWSSIYDLKNNKIYRCEGNPSRKKYCIDKRW